MRLTRRGLLATVYGTGLAACAPAAVTPAATPLEDAIEKAVEAQPAAFDRAVAIAALEAANFEVDPATTDEELVEALAELAK